MEEEFDLVGILPKDKVPRDGKWHCVHGVPGLCCINLECRYQARILEAFERHTRLATERRHQRFPKGCYFDLRQGTDEEIEGLVSEWRQIKKAFISAGLNLTT